MTIDYENVPIKVSGAGAATVISTKPMDGLLQRIRFNIGTLTANTVDLTITDTQTGASILAVTNIAASTDYAVRTAAVTTTNGAIAASYVPIPITGTITIVVADGGNATSGSVDFWVER